MAVRICFFMLMIYYRRKGSQLIVGCLWSVLFLFYLCTNNWTEMERFPVFISYSRRDIDQIGRIRNEVESATGARCWMDLRAIESGAKRFTKDIIDGINNCEVFLFMLTEHSQRSEFALRELDFADKKGKHVVVINVNDCAMTDEFQFLYGLTDTICWTVKGLGPRVARR